MTYIDCNVIFFVQLSQDIQVRSSIKIVYATAQSPFFCKNTNLMHEKRIISAYPLPILKPIGDM